MRKPYELKSTAEEEVRVQGYDMLGHVFLTLVCEGTRKTNSDISKKTNLKERFPQSHPKYNTVLYRDIMQCIFLQLSISIKFLFGAAPAYLPKCVHSRVQRLYNLSS